MRNPERPHEPMKYPIGVQSFEEMRTDTWLYVDKTRYVETLIRGSKYYFLGRPRRFGKSLFLSMLKCFFEGKRALFEGLYIDSIEWDWAEYPVFYLDINANSYGSKEDLDDVLRNHIERWESAYGGRTSTVDNLSVRFSNVIRRAHEITGRQVVVLVDEYDKPLVNSLQDNELYDYFQATLSGFYANFKSSADHLRLVFLTGVSRFGKVSVFSGLNNISDITFDKNFQAVCGITEEELICNFQEGIKNLASAEQLPEEELVMKLRRYYDGYRFVRRGERLYNPFSLLNVMAKEEFSDYWIESGTPTLLVNQLQRYDLNLESVVNSKVPVSELSGIDFDSPNIEALLYQTGYVTIKDYDSNFDEVTLGLPNLEVKRGFMSLIPQNSAHSQTGKFVGDGNNE